MLMVSGAISISIVPCLQDTLNKNYVAFSSERFVYRPISQRDRDNFYALYTDETVMRKVGERLTISQLDSLFDNTKNSLDIQPTAQLMWCIEQDEQFVGILGFVNIDHIHHQAEMGILLRSDRFGKGTASESITRLVAFGFERLFFAKNCVSFQADNHAILKIARKLGYEIKVDDADNKDVYQASLSRQSWQLGQT